MLTQLVFADHLHSLLQQAGVDHSGHSVQIGAATTVAANCCSDATIQLLGRWQSDEIFFRHVHPPQQELAQSSSVLISTFFLSFVLIHYVSSPLMFTLSIFSIITSQIYHLGGRYHSTVIPQEETAP